MVAKRDYLIYNSSDRATGFIRSQRVSTKLLARALFFFYLRFIGFDYKMKVDIERGVSNYGYGNG